MAAAGRRVQRCAGVRARQGLVHRAELTSRSGRLARWLAGEWATLPTRRRRACKPLRPSSTSGCCCVRNSLIIRCKGEARHRPAGNNLVIWSPPQSRSAPWRMWRQGASGACCRAAAATHRPVAGGAQGQAAWRQRSGAVVPDNPRVLVVGPPWCLLQVPISVLLNSFNHRKMASSDGRRGRCCDRPRRRPANAAQRMRAPGASSSGVLSQRRRGRWCRCRASMARPPSRCA